MRKTKKTVIIIFAILILIIFSPYIKTEYLTLKYGNEFIGLEKETNMLNQAKYHKVFSYSKNKAEVFYVSDTGDLITFVKGENNDWQIQEWKTVWSTSGSADDFIWPYYR